MRHMLGRIYRFFAHIGTSWTILGPGGVMTAIYSTLVSFIEPIADAGWAAIILSGVVLAIFTMIGAGMALPVWDRMRQWWRGNAQDTDAAQPDTAPSTMLPESIATPDLGSPVLRSPTLSDGLYAGEIAVSDRPLAKDLFVWIFIRCFNATGGPVRVLRVEGEISFSIDDAKSEASGLPTPRLALEKGPSDNVENLNRFGVYLEQRLARHDADRLIALQPDQTAHLRLAGLRIIFAAADNEETPLRLPNDLMLKKGDDRLRVDGWQLVAGVDETVVPRQKRSRV